ncbi:LuxR C-terminal-related transcriptional regulator [Luethyella okanaganae]|uniref:LuxR C-terminal-related transcriptional regulator n=1 Tax=Luethyella okanaganae TaxID=69372 RepID=A0ABW1VK16_9MICO
MFEHEVRRTIDYVARGMSVRIVGAAGSGRSTVARQVIAELEKTGTPVYGIDADHTFRGTPFAGLGSLGLDIRPRQNGSWGFVDTFAEHVTRSGSPVLVVDGLDTIDTNSMDVIDLVQRRTNCPLVLTMSEYAQSAAGPLPSPYSRWPEAHVQLSPLRYDQVHSLVTDLLKAPVDADTTATILTKSAGNPRLISRIAESAILAHQLALVDGQWRMTGQTLWNEHLIGAVETLLQGLDQNCLSALQAMSMLGAQPVERLWEAIAPDTLAVLERRGLVQAMDDIDGDIHAAVSPPLIADYFRDERIWPRYRIQERHTTRALDASLRPMPAEEPPSPTIANVIAALRLERTTENAAATRYFLELLQSREQVHFDRWDAQRTMSNAVAFLRVHWGTPVDPDRVATVFRHTDASAADPAEHLFFTMTHAMWSLSRSGDLDAARRALVDFGTDHAAWRPEIDAFALFLQANAIGIPEDIDGFFARSSSHHPRSGVLAVVRGMLEVYRFNPQAALDAVDGADGFELVPRIEPFIRGLAMFGAGRIEEALVFAAGVRTASRQEVDQFGFVASSYVAAVSLIYLGHFDEAEHVIGCVLAMGRPGFLVDSLYDAMLRLACIRTATAAPTSSEFSLASQASADAPDVGPLPGIGKGVYDLLTQFRTRPDAFEGRAIDLVTRQLDRGFVLEAVYSSLLALCVMPGARILEEVRTLLSERGVTSHDQLLDIAEAVLDDDHQRLTKLLDRYEYDGDTYQVGMLLRGAAQRHVLYGESAAAGALQRAASAFTTRFPRAGQHMTIRAPQDSLVQLTAREVEIAFLAGKLTNTEIAKHLGISIRTVEHHISNALKKSHVTTRSDLFDRVRYLPDLDRSGRITSCTGS